MSNGYIVNGTGALNSSEGPAAHLQVQRPGNIQSFFQLFSNFCSTGAGSFNHGSDVAYYNPMIQPQTVEPPPMPVPAPEQGTTESMSVNPKQYNAILRRRQLRNLFPSPEHIIATRQREIDRARQCASNKRPRGDDGRFISMNQQRSESSGDAYNSIPQVDYSVEPTSSSHGCIPSANETDQHRIIWVPESSEELGATTNTGAQCWQEAKSNPENTASSTQCTALMPSDLAVLPPPKEEPDMECRFLADPSDLVNLDDIEFDLTGMFDEPIPDDASGSTTAPVAEEMVLPPTMLRHRLSTLKEYLIQNPAETFVKDVSTVQDILSGIANTELPTDTYLALCEIVSLMDMGTEYDAAKERQKKREKMIGLTQRLMDNKSVVNASFWCFQEEQRSLAQEKFTKAILQLKIAGLEEEMKKAKSQLVSVSSSMINRMGRLKKLQEDCDKEKEASTALAAELNEQITVMLGDVQADEELMGRPARVVEAAKQKIDVLLAENP